MTPEYSRTAAIAVNTPGLTYEENRRLRDALIEAEEYEKLDAWAKEKYDEAHVIYLKRFPGASPPDTPPPEASADEVARARQDRFVGRVEDLVWASCVSCLRKSRGPVCEAYPDGIPEVILNGKVDHKTPYPGDRGLTYLAIAPPATTPD